MINNILIRKSKKDDSLRLWEIRNHPSNRKYFHNQNKIDFKDHDEWYKNKYFKNKKNFCYVLKKNKKIIGYCRYDLLRDNYRISIAIDPEFRQKGLGDILLKKSLNKIKTKKNILAETKKNNIRSYKLFKKNNFTVYKEDKNSYYFKYTKTNNLPANYVVATIKKWNIDNYKKYCKKNTFHLIKERKNLTINKLRKLNPKYIFFPHWSWIIPDEIWKNYNCVVFHMTDLPYGRGGTPLQNLIMRGHKKTKISAIQVNKGIDTGKIYIKESLDLNGSADEIYKKASEIIFKKMIPYIIKNNPTPFKQKGKIVNFKRRTPKQSKILNNMNLNKVFDLIRMLDAENYPRAFLETKKIKFDFSQAKKKNNKIIAKAEIYEK